MSFLNIALIADRNVEVGLHVTLHSALSSLDPDEQVVAHLFLKGFNEKHVENIKSTIREFGSRCEIAVYDIANVDLGKGIGLHGNKMPYMLFQLPNMVNAERVLYLDADLLVKTNLAQLNRLDLGEKAIGVVSRSTVSQALDRDFLRSVGVDHDSPYYNTGVVLIDIPKWNARNLTAECFKFAESYSSHLKTADQTVVNAILGGQIQPLPQYYNVGCYPDSPAIDVSNDGIYHFLGSPKPWDFMAEFFHSNYPAFESEMKLTYFKRYRSYKNVSIPQSARTIRLIRSYCRTFTKKLKK